MLSQRDALGWWRSTVNQFLGEMDSPDSNNEYSDMFMSRPYYLMDALPNHLSLRLFINLPLEADHAAILNSHLTGKRYCNYRRTLEAGL